MMYLNPNRNESGAYCAPQSLRADGLLIFPDEFMAVFYPTGKELAGFVSIEHDGERVTSCVWNEEAYQAYLVTVPTSAAPVESLPSTMTDAELAAALLDGINDI